MRAGILILVTLVALAGGVLAEGDAAKEKGADDLAKWAHHTGDIDFVVGYEDGKKEAQFSGRPMMLFFTTTWCGYCKKLAGESFKDPKVREELQLFVPVIVDGDVEKEIVKQYGVSGYPNIVFETLDGKKHGHVAGYVPTEKFLAQVEGAKKSVGRVKFSRDYVKIVRASMKLEKAMKDEDYSDAIDAIEDVEKVGHEGPELRRAMATKKHVEEIATKRLEAARAQMAEDPDEAKKELRKISKEFKGLDVADEAKELMEEIG